MTLKFNELSPRQKGIFAILCSSLSFALMSVFVRLSGDLPSIQKSFFRNFVAVIVSAYLLYREKPKLILNKKSAWLMFGRSVFGTGGILFNYYAIDHLPLSDASMLGKLSPFFTLLFCYFFLKEKINFVQFTSIILAFFGAIFVMKPTGTIAEFFPSFIGILGGICAGAAYTFIRAVSANGLHKKFIIFGFSLFSCVVTLPYLLFFYTPMTTTQIGYLLLAGLAATGGQFGITTAYSYAPASEISVYDYAQIPFAALLGLLLFAQVPDLLSIIGYFIIFGAALLSYFKGNAS
ncbi:MAG: DMT family transporter [Bacillota bacterium]